MIDLQKSVTALQGITPQKKRVLMLVFDILCLIFAAFLAAYIASTLLQYTAFSAPS